MAEKKKAKKKKKKKKAVATKPPVKAIKEPYTKSQLFTEIAERTDMKKKDIVAVFDVLGSSGTNSSRSQSWTKCQQIHGSHT